MSGTNGKLPYHDFLAMKSQLTNGGGFKPIFMPDKAMDFQQYCIEWNLWNPRSALLQDCGMGKTLQELAWAENIVRHTNKRVLILTPLAVAHQTVGEGEKFGIECKRSIAGELNSKIIVTNYERLHYFNPNDFIGMVGDEASRLKNFKGKTKVAVTQFMKKLQYRLLATATAAPNDYPEIGTLSEALGELGYMDMLKRFFKNDKNNSSLGRHYGKKMEWRFRGHAERKFWQWVASWARAMRKPSDYGFDDKMFILPDLVECDTFVDIANPADGWLFNLPAVGWKEQRKEVKRTIKERCDKVAELVNHKQSVFIGCHRDKEGDYLEKIVDGGVQISGRDTDDQKEEKFLRFLSGDIRALITKPKIGAWGLNFQHCAHVAWFPSDSYEEYYQFLRRCYRFGQKNVVRVDRVLTEGQRKVLENVDNKAKKADQMFTNLVAEMNNSTKIDRSINFTKKEVIPAWL